jgi:hypothetical protein
MNPDRDLDIDVAKFKFLWPLAYPKESKDPSLTKFMLRLVKDDTVQFGQMFEKALEVQCNLIRESTAGKDFVTGQDAKCIVARTSNYGQGYSAPIFKLQAKTGDLLVSCYERKQDKWYLFRIPYSAYKHISKTSNIDIPFELDGTPRKVPSRAVKRNWWTYEVTDIKDLII